MSTVQQVVFDHFHQLAPVANFRMVMPCYCLASPDCDHIADFYGNGVLDQNRDFRLRMMKLYPQLPKRLKLIITIENFSQLNLDDVLCNTVEDNNKIDIDIDELYISMILHQGTPLYDLLDKNLILLSVWPRMWKNKTRSRN